MDSNGDFANAILIVFAENLANTNISDYKFNRDYNDFTIHTLKFHGNFSFSLKKYNL